MSYNGSGSFTINSTGQPVVDGTDITATVHNALTADLASGLSNAICKDGQTTVTANIPFGGNKLTGVGAATTRTDGASLATIQDGTGVYVATVGGTADVITLTVSPAITSYVAGQEFWWIASGANTTNVTVNVSGLGAKALTKDGTTALVANDILSGALIGGCYDGTRFQLLARPSLTAAATLTNKTLALGSNTISGTTAQFNTALTDNDFATLAGSETLTNKTLSAPVFSGTATGTLTVQSGATTIITSKGASDYGAFYADGATGSSAFYFSAINSVERSRIQTTTGGDVAIHNSASGAVTEKLRLTAAGDLGLGGTPANYANYANLSLNGTDGGRIDFKTGGSLVGVIYNGLTALHTIGFMKFDGTIGRSAPVTKTTSFTLADTENWIICNSASAITVTLPAASSWTGREVMLKTRNTGTVVSASSNVKPLDTDTAGTAILSATAGNWATLVSDGTNWVIMQGN